MASIPDDDTEDLSFSDWCDRKFTNMYSHNEFVSPPSRSSRSPAPKARPKMTSANHPKGSEESHQHKGHGRMTSPSFRFSKDTAIRPQDVGRLQPARSPSLERWQKFSDKTRKIDVGSSSIKSLDKIKSLTVNDNLSGRGSTSESVFVEGTQQEENRISPRNQDAKVQALQCITEDALVEDDVQDGRRLSVDSGSSGQESHTSKRTYSELSSPGKMQTRCRKWKKRLRGLGSSPRKDQVVQHKAVDKPAGPTQSADDSFDDDWGSSKVGCVWDLTKSTAAETKSNSKDDIKPDEESTRLFEKDNTATWEDKKQTGGNLTKTSAERGQQLTTVNIKYRNKSKKSNSHNPHAAEQTKQVYSGEFEVEFDSEDMKHEMWAVAAEQAVVGDVVGLQVLQKCKITGKEVQEDDKQQDKNSISPTSQDSSSRSQVQGFKENEEYWDDEDKTLGNLAEKSTERVQQCTTVKLKYRKKSKTSQSKTDLGAEQLRRVPSGEYDIESSVDSEETKPEIRTVIANKKVIGEGSQISGRGERATKVDRKSTKDVTTKSRPIQRAQDVSAESTTAGTSVTKMDKEKRQNTARRKKSVEISASDKQEQLKDEKRQQHVKVDQQSQQLRTPSSLKDTSCKVVPREQKSNVKFIPSAKGTNAKDIHKATRVTKGKEAKIRSASLRDKLSGTDLFTKRVLESALKPQCPSKMAAKMRPKSAETSKICGQTDHPRKMQRKMSWPAPKVHLEHIYKAFDSDTNSDSKEEEQSRTSVRKSDTKAGWEMLSTQRDETSGVQDCRPSIVLHPQKIQYQTKEMIQAQLLSPQLSATDAGTEPTACLTEDGQFKSDAMPARLDSKPVKPEGAPRITPQFLPRSVSRRQEQVTGAENVHEVSNETSEHVAGHSQEISFPNMNKTDRIREWLDMQDEPPRPNTSNLVSSKSVTRKQQKALEPGKVSDDSSESDKAWEQLVDSIMKGNNEEVFSSSYCKRVQPKCHVTGLRSITPFRTSSFPVEVDFKPRIPPGQKNVATVPPYCVHLATSQPKKSLVCTWSGPVPDFWDGNRPLSSSPPPFNPFSPEAQKSPDADSAVDIRSSSSVFRSGQGNTETAPTEVDRRAPGEYPGNKDGCWSPTVLHTNAVPGFSTTPKARSVIGVAPRFLRLAQIRANKGRPVSVHISSRLSSSPGCVYSGGIHRDNLVSTSISQPTSSPQSPAMTPSGVSPKPTYRPWTSGSVGWSSSLTRTSGTITPTRFTPWTTEATTPCPWKTYQGSQSSSVELSPVVDYPTSPVPYIDTHCHIDFLFQRSEFRGTFEKFSKVHNFPDNYAGCLAVFCTPEAFQQGALWEDLVMEKNIWVAFGCHPHHAKSYDGIVEENIIRCMRHPKVGARFVTVPIVTPAIALGEIGLDYSNRCTSDRPLQLQVFRRQLQIALHLGKPLVIHSREAEHDTLSLMSEVVPRNYKIHRHCFTGSPQEARNFFRAFPNSFIGLTALVTFPSAYPVHRTASEIPLGKILLETDAPYFLPKQCPRIMRWANPSMAVFVAARIAQLRGLPLDEVLHTVRRNTTEMYGI